VRLLLTGATGFVGRNFLLRALSQYDAVFTPVRSEEKLRAQLVAEGLDPRPGNLHVLPPEPLDWPDCRPDHALLGAGVLFARSRDEYFSTNVDWTLRGLRTLPDACRVTVLSSLSAGGPTPARQDSRSETDSDTPITWYGESKLALERILRSDFSRRNITVLRPPMILGARDTATLPLFRMAGHFLRIKPGLQTKTYSFLAVEDLVDGILEVFQQAAALPPESYYVSAARPVTDGEILAGAAACRKVRGLTVPIPQPAVRLLSALVDVVPSLRKQVPSLTRDRAREIWPSRWVADGARLSGLTGWRPRRDLEETLRSTHNYFLREGLL
jgi:dihydroflavonol-4-reductase